MGMRNKRVNVSKKSLLEKGGNFQAKKAKISTTHQLQNPKKATPSSLLFEVVGSFNRLLEKDLVMAKLAKLPDLDELRPYLATESCMAVLLLPIEVTINQRKKGGR